MKRPMRIVRVAVLDDHAVVIDGYRYKLAATPEIEIVFAAHCGSEFEEQLAATPVEVVLLDISVPTAPDNPNFYPIPAALPRLHIQYPNLNFIIATVAADRPLIETMLAAGATGYLVKSDVEAHARLPEIIAIVADGGQYLSHTALQQLRRAPPGPGEVQLTKRQAQVLSLCAAYPDNPLGDLAQQLSISPTTVRNLMSQIYLRLDVRTRHAAVLRAQKLGFI